MEVGKAICVQGDSRELEKVMKKKVDKIISSPPYAENTHHSDNPQELEYLRPGRKARVAGTAGEREDNIGQLSYDQADKIITSPPYSNVVSNDKEGPSAGANERKYGRWKKGTAKKQSYTQSDELSKINKIITSPPFGQAQSGGGIAKKGYDGPKHSPTDLIGKRSYMPENTGKNKKNISNMPYADKVITSPPYQETISKSTSRMCREEMDRKLWHSDYGNDKKNIGNLKQQTYLEAMAIVYDRCYRVLKSEGLMILILKDFIRKGKRVPLGEDTIKLCELAGFTYIKTYHRKIENPSFWRILYEQKYPDAEKIDCEDILCFRKELKCPKTNS